LLDFLSKEDIIFLPATKRRKQEQERLVFFYLLKHYWKAILAESEDCFLFLFS